MPLFVCDDCGTVENTALGLYWLRVGETKLCSACGNGQWHDRFPRMTRAEYLAAYPEAAILPSPWKRAA